MGMSVYQKVSKNVGSPIAGLCPVKKTNIDELGGPLYMEPSSISAMSTARVTVKT